MKKLLLLPLFIFSLNTLHAQFVVEAPTLETQNIRIQGSLEQMNRNLASMKEELKNNKKELEAIKDKNEEMRQYQENEDNRFLQIPAYVFDEFKNIFDLERSIYGKANQIFGMLRRAQIPDAPRLMNNVNKTLDATKKLGNYAQNILTPLKYRMSPEERVQKLSEFRKTLEGVDSQLGRIYSEAMKSEISYQRYLRDKQQWDEKNRAKSGRTAKIHY